jgi:hypothetical protein
MGFFILRFCVVFVLFLRMISWDCVYSSDDDETSSTRFLTTRVEHVAFLKDAFGKAQQYITIVSPYISSYAIEADDLEDTILEAQFRGVTVSVYTDKKLDAAPGGDIKENAERGRNILRGLLCDLHIVDKVHAKTLMVDGILIATGSFNWLSAVRNDASAYANLEHTLVIDNSDLAAKFTESAMKSISDLSEVDHPYRGFYEGFNIGEFFASSSDAEDLAWWITVNQGKGLFSFDEQRELTDMITDLVRAYGADDEGGEEDPDLVENCRDNLMNYVRASIERVYEESVKGK